MVRPLILDGGRNRQLPLGTALDFELGQTTSATSALANAPAGDLIFGSRKVADYHFQTVIGPLGKERILMPMALNSTPMRAVAGGSGASVTQDGGTLGFTGTVTHQSFGSTYYQRHGRARVATSTVVGNAGGWRNSAIGEIQRSEGGMLFCRFGIALLVTGQRGLVGLSNSIAAQSNINPLTDTTISKLGMAHDTNTGNWSMVHNLAGAAPTVIGMGADFPINTTDAFDLFIHLKPNSDVVWEAFRLSTTDGSWVASAGGTLTTNLPAAASPIGRYGLVTNNAQAAAAALDFHSLCLFPY